MPSYILLTGNVACLLRFLPSGSLDIYSDFFLLHMNFAEVVSLFQVQPCRPQTLPASYHVWLISSPAANFKQGIQYKAQGEIHPHWNPSWYHKLLVGAKAFREWMLGPAAFQVVLGHFKKLQQQPHSVQSGLFHLGICGMAHFILHEPFLLFPLPSALPITMGTDHP